MKFFLYTAEIKNKNNKPMDAFLEEVSLKKYVKLDTTLGYGYFFSELTDSYVSVIAYVKNSTENPPKLSIPFEELNIDVGKFLIEEITSRDFCNAIYYSDASGYIRSAGHILSKLKMLGVFSPNGFLSDNRGYYEAVATSNNRRTITATLKKTMWYSSMKDELTRIYTPSAKKGCFKIPVHYILKGDSFESRDLAVGELVAALYQNKRIQSKRYGVFSISNFDESDLQLLHKIYTCYSGGTIVIKYRENACREGGLHNVDTRVIEAFCEQILLHKHDVQTVLCFPQNCCSEKEIFMSYLSKLPFIEMEEDRLNTEEAINYLLYCAKNKKLQCSDTFLSTFRKNREYTLKELDNAIESYEDTYYRTEIFPQYSRNIAKGKEYFTEKIEGDAYARLQNLIGLSEAKKTIDSILNFARVQTAFKDKRGSLGRPSLHMCFTGAPGTAKTTVARLLAEILRDNKCLTSGHLVECSRADLVGKYVGHTAKQVKHRFMQAMGGVLFIDEAYSLLDDREGLFGDEAINTIVQCMENYRDDVVVIFAGYPEEMEKFLTKNPGLKSRIAFHVHFEDYNAEELYSITELLAQENHLKFSKDVKPKLVKLYEKASEEIGFGNGRYARNLMEKALLHQASRLVASGFDSIDEENLSTITAEDFASNIENNSLSTHCKIGFCL